MTAPDPDLASATDRWPCRRAAIPALAEAVWRLILALEAALVCEERQDVQS
ncbi:MAG: hypothetical protein AMXMBFR64_60850 [Myxococcales bacterium]